MRRVGQARRRDANEPAIVDALTKCGFRVHRISSPGFADLIIYASKTGLVLMEVKAPKTGRLTAQQVRHTEQGWPVVVVHTVAEALAAVGVTQ